MLVPAVLATIAACGSAPTKDTGQVPPGVGSPTPPPSTKYYKDDGPGDNAPANLDAIPDAVPRIEAPPGLVAPRDVFLFFISADKEKAPAAAMALLERLLG